MKYDKKIDDRAMILNCLDVEFCKKTAFSSGYFTDDIDNYSDLSRCKYGILTDITENGVHVYQKDNNDWFAFFLPESAVKKEKKYRPFIDTKEFFIKTNFEAGDLIHIRSKPHNHEYHLLLVGWTDEGLMLGNFSEMTFNELFDLFELWDGEDKFIPFGVEK